MSGSVEDVAAMQRYGIKLGTLDEATAHRARLTVAGHAADRDELRQLLRMLGLLDRA